MGLGATMAQLGEVYRAAPEQREKGRKEKNRESGLSPSSRRLPHGGVIRRDSARRRSMVALRCAHVPVVAYWRLGAITPSMFVYLEVS
jgi:hypothetical protein